MEMSHFETQCTLLETVMIAAAVIGYYHRSLCHTIIEPDARINQ